MDFYGKLTEICQENGITPRKLTTLLNISSANATFWRNGSVPRPRTIKKIAEYFGVPMSYFYDDDVSTVDINPFYVKIEKLCEATGTTVDNLINKMPEDVGKTIKYKGTVKKPSDLQRIARYFGINREYFRDYIPIEPLPEELDRAQTASAEVIKKEPADFSIDKLPENTDREKLIKQLMQQADELSNDKLRKLIALIELSK